VPPRRCTITIAAQSPATIGDHLTYITDLVVGTSGAVFASESGSATLWRFEPDLQRATVIGRRGQGPGEFRVAPKLSVSSDGIVAADVAQRRVSVFTESGRLRSSATPDALVAPTFGATRVHLIRAYGDRLILQQRRAQRTAQNPFSEMQGSVATVALPNNSDRLDTVALHAPLLTTVVSSARAPALVISPMQAPTIVAISAGGDATVVLDQPRRPDGRRALLATFILAGRPSVVRELAYPRIPLSASDRAGFVRQAPNGDAEQSAALSMMASFNDVPGAINAFVSRDTTVWVSRQAVTKATVFDVYSFEGKRLGSCSMPLAYRVHEVHGASAWGVVFDDDGVPWPTRFALRWNR
jgi:hypothetical protein